MMVGMTRNITQKLCMYDQATSFNTRHVSRAAAVMLLVELLV
jgi:hypothetical protein